MISIILRIITCLFWICTQRSLLIVSAPLIPPRLGSLMVTSVCENNMIVIECPPDSQIRVVEVYYGRTLNDRQDFDCNYGEREDDFKSCRTNQAESIVSAKCNGNLRCHFSVNNEFFNGDPCEGLPKYLELKHKCVATRTSSSTQGITTSSFVSTTAVSAAAVLPTSSTWTSGKTTTTTTIMTPESSTPASTQKSDAITSASNISFVCEKNGTISVDFSNCRSLRVMQRVKEFNVMMRNRSSIRSEDVLSQLTVVRQLPAKSLNKVDVQQLSTDLDSLSRISITKMVNSSPEKAANISAEIFHTSALLLSANNAWNHFSSHESRQVSSRILGVLERAGSQTGLPSRRLSAPRVEQQVNRLSKGQRYTSAVLADGDAFRLNLIDNANVSVAFTRVVGISQYLQPDNESELHNFRIQSEVVSVKVSNNIDKVEVEFFLHHSGISLDKASRVCAWLSLENVTWSTSGCEVQVAKSSDLNTSCRCNHLTNFAVLMDFTGSMTRILVENPAHSWVLTLLSVIGCLLASVCLILALLTFGVIRKHRSPRDILHLHVCLCLLIGEVLFMITALFQPKQLGPIACGMLAGFLHYFFLAAFFCMLCEGAELWFLVVKVFQTVSRKKIYYLVSYLTPLLIVAISSSMYPQGYGTNQHCFLSTERGLIWAFAGPVCGVLAFNFVIFAITLRVIYVTSAKSPMEGKHQNHKAHEIRTWIKTSLILVILLGLTWTLGLLKTGNRTVDLVLAYVFVLVNTLQGAAFFVVHVLLHEKVRKEWIVLALRQTWLPHSFQTWLREHSGPTTSSNNQKAGRAVLRGDRAGTPSSSKQRSSLTPLQNISCGKVNEQRFGNADATQALLDVGVTHVQRKDEHAPDSGYLDEYKSDYTSGEFRSEPDSQLFNLGNGTVYTTHYHVYDAHQSPPLTDDGYLVPLNTRVHQNISVATNVAENEYLVPRNSTRIAPASVRLDEAVVYQPC